MQEEFNTDENGNRTLSVIVRGSGFFLMVIGLLVSLMTIREAIKLYHEPQQIERFALAIETGSNIDKSLGSLRDKAIADSRKDSAAGEADPAPARNPETMRVSYFLAWIIVFLLLLLIARLALAAIKTGGELVLYDMQIKRFARMLIKEAGKR